MHRKNPSFKPVPGTAPSDTDAPSPGPTGSRSPWPDPQKFLAGARRSRPHPPLDAAAPGAERQAPAKRNSEEIRVYGRNACLAVFAKRPQDLRKAYLTEARIAEFKPVLAWCVKNRLGYRVVESDDLDRLTEAQHHEGVCFEVRRQAPLSLSMFLQSSLERGQSALLIWLDGVGNPHNVGAMLRSAANFGVRGVILPTGSPSLSGAAMRVAEGGAEAVPVLQAQAGEDVAAMLRAAGFSVAATVPRDGVQLYKSTLPPRLVLIFGAEGEGMSVELIRRADLRLTIPGSGAVESLNVSASAAVSFAEYWRQQQGLSRRE